MSAQAQKFTAKPSVARASMSHGLPARWGVVVVLIVCSW